MRLFNLMPNIALGISTLYGPAKPKTPNYNAIGAVSIVCVGIVVSIALFVAKRFKKSKKNNDTTQDEVYDLDKSPYQAEEDIEKQEKLAKLREQQEMMLKLQQDVNKQREQDEDNNR